MVRYACMSRPFFRSAPVEKRTAKVISTNRNECSVTLRDLFENEERRTRYVSRRI